MKNCLKGCIVKVFLFIQKQKRKNGKLLATLIIFSFFLLKWNYRKLGDRYAIFLFFSFFEQNGKNEKMVRINVFTFGGAKRSGSDRECKYFPIGMNAREPLWR